MKVLTLLGLILLAVSASAQNLYVKTFGDPKKPAVVFLHGGPGYNAVAFEVTTAQTLAESGFYVIVYDRRGEGRSQDPNASYTFDQSVSDLDSLVSSLLPSLKQNRLSLIGHSFGGVIGVKYAEKYPGNVRALVLVGAPVALQESFRTMIGNCRERSRERNDTSSLKFLDRLAAMDTASLMYSSLVFSQAMKNGLYSPKSHTDASRAIFNKLKEDSSTVKRANSFNAAATTGFFKNEHYTTINLRPNLSRIIANGTKVYGLYGQEDGLYSEAQVKDLAVITGSKNLKYIAGASHNVFIDQQGEFISALKSWAK